ncbi:MAG: RMD1 family protein [Pseudomonadota bacterium]
MTATGGRVRARAWLLAERLDAAGLVPDGVWRSGPLALTAEAGVAAFAFRWGAVVMIGGDESAERTLLERVRARADQPLATAFEETAWLEPASRDDVEADGTIRLGAFDTEHLALVADVLAKSAALAHQEERLGQTLEQIAPAVERLERRGRFARSTRPLLRAIGAALAARSRATARVEVEDKPDLLWVRPDLEPLHARLVDEFELKERSTALERKLVLIGETVQTLLSLVEARRSLGLELAVGTLVAIEVLTALYQSFLG